MASHRRLEGEINAQPAEPLHQTERRPEKAEKRRLKEEFELPAKRLCLPDAIILQVGNRIHHTTRSTLKLAGEGSFLHTLACLDEMDDKDRLLPLRRSPEGFIMIDRCGDKFQVILDALRQGPDWFAACPPHQLADLEAEARFYCLWGLSLIRLLGPPRLLQTSEDLRFEEIPRQSSWILRGETNEVHQVLLWVPDLSNFQLSLQVLWKRSSTNSGLAKVHGWGLDFDTASFLAPLETQIIASTRKPWQLPRGPARTWHLLSSHSLRTEKPLPEDYFQPSPEPAQLLEVLPHRPRNARMPPVKACYESENDLSTFTKVEPDRHVRIEIWPELPCYWAPRAGEGPGVVCAPLAQASVAGVKILRNGTAETPRSEECFWVSSSAMEWNYCFWNAVDSSLSSAEACVPQGSSGRVDVQTAPGFVSFKTEGHAVISRNYALPTQSGCLRLWFLLQDFIMTEAQVRLTVSGHVEGPL